MTDEEIRQSVDAMIDRAFGMAVRMLNDDEPEANVAVLGATLVAIGNYLAFKARSSYGADSNTAFSAATMATAAAEHVVIDKLDDMKDRLLEVNRAAVAAIRRRRQQE